MGWLLVSWLIIEEIKSPIFEDQNFCSKSIQSIQSIQSI